jgi:hypothetical protein
MAKRQWTVLFIGGLLMLLSEVFPPWVYEDGWTSRQRSAGYHFLTKPPAVKSQSEMKRIFAGPVEEPARYFAVHRDRARLLGQRSFLLTATIGLLFVMHRPRRRWRLAFGSLALCITSALLCLYAFWLSTVW